MATGQPLISIIIPVYNDSLRLERLLLRLDAIRELEYENLQIIVAARPSTDDTEMVARRFGARVVQGGKPSEGRNAGAAVATGEIFLFLDADSVPNYGTLPTIARAVDQWTAGTCTAFPDHPTALAMFTVALQNFLRWSGMVRGLTNLLFLHGHVWRSAGLRYDPKRNVGEHADLIRRAMRAGARFRYFRIRRGCEFSVHRYERVGYLRTFLFWARWFVLVYLLRKSDAALENEYWSS